MAIEESGISLPPEGDIHAQGEGTRSEEIISVNARGRRQSAGAGPFLMLGGIVFVVLIGVLATVNIMKARLGGIEKPRPAASRDTVVLARDFSSEASAPLPGAQETRSRGDTSPVCPDGSMGNELRGRDGVVVRNGSGQSVRVCANGQVAGVTVQASGGQAIALQPVGPQSREVPMVKPTHSGPLHVDGPMMLTDGKYGSEELRHALVVPQDDAGLAVSPDGRNQPKAEGLLTGAAAAGSLEGQLTPSRTPMVQAGRLNDLNLLLPKGRTIDCGMSMRIISSLAGQASCVVTTNVYSANGRVLLIERGSEAVGEYRSGVSLGQKRLFVLWSRIITPGGVVINLNSPGADELGSTGLTGKVDNHWFERIGSAFLLSTIQDAIQYEIATQQGKSGNNTLVLGNTAQTGSEMAQRVLESTINIPPTIYKNQGDRAVIYVARDLDFSNVYRLRAKP